MPDTPSLSCDVAIIGAGTAGLSAARGAMDQGAKILLIDEAFSGPVCARDGCMPSKLLIAASRVAHTVSTADIFGFDVSDAKIDRAAVMERVRRERDRFVASTLKGLEDFPKDSLITGHARFSGPNSLVLDDGRSISARAIVIATGAKPALPAPFSGLGDRVLTHETVFELDTLPESLAVIGSGPIGVELAQAFARLGVRTSLFDKSETIGGIEDHDVQKTLQNLLRDEMALHPGVDLDAERHGDTIRLTWTGQSSGQDDFDYVLVAAGRPPSLDGLDLEKAGIACSDKGVPKYDKETLQCGDSAIFIAGDASAKLPVLHEATAEGRIAGMNAANYPDVARFPRMVPFTLMFSQPALAQVGLPPSDDSVIGEASYADQGRAKVEAEAVGLVRIFAEPTRGRITGAVLLCPGAEHMAHLFALAIARQTTAADMLALPLYHPTLEEGLKDALRDICKAVPASGAYNRHDPPGA